MYAFRFDQADLEANRAGKLSDKQFKSLDEKCVLNLSLGIILMVVMFGSLIVGVANPTTFSGFLLIGLVAGVLSFAPLSRYRKIKRDLDNVSVLSVEGKITTRVVSRAGSLELQMGDISFIPYYWKPEEFRANERYSVYYLTHSNRILSIERLPDRP